MFATKLLKTRRLDQAREPGHRARKQALLLSQLLVCTAAPAHELTERLSLDGVLSAALQCQNLSDNSIAQDTCKGAAPLQPAFTYRSTKHGRLSLKLGFAAGDGLNQVSPFNIPSWGADLNDDVINVNGSGRDYLLELWYEHVVRIETRNQLELTVGIIDAAAYLDHNRYANDEYTQFMNAALSNAPNAFFPSYAPGVAAEWHIHQWTLAGVIMEVHQETADTTYGYYGLQVGYRLESSLGVGNYRIVLNRESDFEQAGIDSSGSNNFMILSLDQQVGEKLGLFARIGSRLDDEPINYKAIFSGGADFRGIAWGRKLDNIGIGLARLKGGGILDSTTIAETYYRLVVNPYLALTADIQFMQDRYRTTRDIEGFVYSLRTTFNF